MRRSNFFLIGCILLLLSGCENDDFSDLQAYIATVKARPSGQVKPLPEFKDVDGFKFQKENGLRDPFKPIEKIKAIASVDEVEDIEPDNGIHPDKARIKEPLEAFPLSSLRMVGTIEIKSERWGLIKNEGLIYRVKAGQHLGKNDGKIIRVDKNKIDLVEIVPSKPNHFIEQSASLFLTE
jgi:type IV pilus assembly protein PilP